MELLNVVLLVVVGLCLVLLVVALVQLNSLGNALSALDDRMRKGQRSSDQAGSGERVTAALVNLSDQVRRVDLGVDALKRQVGRAPARAIAEAAANGPRPEPLVARVADQPTPQRRDEMPEAARVPSGDSAHPLFRDVGAMPQGISDRSPSSPIEAPTGGRRDEILDEYKALIAQPRKADINRWIDDRGGEGCEATEDGGFQPLGRDAGGLLVLLKVSDHSAVVLPGGRLIVDFATNFANTISLRSVTRQSFELVEDGTGVLRLIEPARAELRGGIWRLAQPGCLSGLKPD